MKVLKTIKLITFSIKHPFITGVITLLLIMIATAQILVVKQINIKTDKNTKASIVFITDIHTDDFLTTTKLNKLVRKSNKIEPDILVLGGDMATITNSTDQTLNRLDKTLEYMSKIKAKYGKYFVLGNHDRFTSVDNVLKIVKKHQFKILINDGELISIGKGKIYIYGVDDLLNGEPTMKFYNKSFKEDYISLIVSHNPDYSQIIEKGSADYMLSGHTHHGQISLFGLIEPMDPSRYFNKFTKYKVVTNGMTVITASGAGTGHHIPLRFWALPDIVYITINQ